MSGKFLNDEFLLHNQTAKTLFFNDAKDMPIIDYHCHLDPKEIYENGNFTNITAAWLYGDHYKWRLMRTHGIDERYITGDASDYEKFMAWAKTVPYTIGNPIYTWTHLELKRFFHIDLTLNPETAPQIWDRANKLLATSDFSCRNLIYNSEVKLLCTTDDPVDSLKYHKLLAEEESRFTVLPTFRPDIALDLSGSGFNSWIDKLAEASGSTIQSFTDLLEAMKKRIDYFHLHGCRLSDHGFVAIHYEPGTMQLCEQAFAKRLRNEVPNLKELRVYQTELLVRLIQMYAEKGWTMQLHIQATRNNNSSMFDKLGPNTGFDAVNDEPIAHALSGLFDRSEQEGELPKTIIYSLNPNDNPIIIALIQCFQQGMPGKIQLGSGWWFNDTWSGMRDQLTRLAEGGMLYHFVGMLTDSRSFLSYTRHEYFRRILCGWLGELDDRGEAPDLNTLGMMVRNIAYQNAEKYFGFELK